MRSFIVPAALLATASSVVAADAPTFKSTSIKAPFVEQFDLGWNSRWTPSEATKKTPVGDETYSYVGKWNVESPAEPLILGDEGLVAKNKAAHHAISAKFGEPVTFTEPLVVQYEVKYQKGGNCGGGYVKLLEQKFFDSGAEFDDKAPWTIMFGPDLTCPGSKIHFIFQHTNPITGVKEEKQINAAPNPSFGSDTNLYTLVVNPDNTYEILFNNESKKKGSLLEDFMPPVNPEKEIDDPEDFKPADWVDQQQIPDPEATKPADWDEDAPLEIPDMDAEKPEGWLDSEPATIPDPDATKPEEWDDEEDGDWIAPTVANPACIDGPGCGEWKRPMMRNPEYKGKWYAPYIDNPAYKGAWAPRKIANPAYFEDKSPFQSLAAIGGVGIELWTMTEDILFDNVYVGHSVADAKAFADESYGVKATLEKAAADKIIGEDATDKISALKKDPAAFIQSEVLKFIELAQVDPIVAIKSEPITAGALVLAIFTLFGMIGTLVGMISGAAAPSKPASSKADTKAPVVNAKSTAVADKDESSLKKRK